MRKRHYLPLLDFYRLVVSILFFTLKTFFFTKDSEVLLRGYFERDDLVFLIYIDDACELKNTTVGKQAISFKETFLAFQIFNR